MQQSYCRTHPWSAASSGAAWGRSCRRGRLPRPRPSALRASAAWAGSGRPRHATACLRPRPCASREGGGDEGGDHPAPAPAGMGEGVALEAEAEERTVRGAVFPPTAAALSGGAGNLRHGGLDAFVGVADDRLHAAQAATGQLARGNSVQIGSASDVPISRPRTSRRPSVLTPMAMIAATDTIRPPRRTLRQVASIQSEPSRRHRFEPDGERASRPRVGGSGTPSPCHRSPRTGARPGSWRSPTCPSP